MKWPFTWGNVLEFFTAYCVLCLPFAICGLTWLFWFFTCVYLMFVLFEMIASNTDQRKSLSQTFWDYKAKYPVRAWICIGGMSLFWLYIILHFTMGI